MTGGHDPLVGRIIDGRYEILARLGEGGMGVVYQARQTSIDRIVALKMLSPHVASDPTWVQRFYNEARACSRLQHPNTIRMFDFGQTSDGRLFMTMELLEGLSLHAALQHGPMAPHRVVKILMQCCASLAEAHAIGIIHRDIKPDNVFLLHMPGSPDFVKLLDFSVAKLLEGSRMATQAGVVFGTPQYMSPEQGRGLPLDARSDLYALGVLGFEMLTGHVPFHHDNAMTVIQMHLHAGVPPMPDTVPYALQQIVRRALEKTTNQRYQSAGEMMQHCQHVMAELAGALPVPPVMTAPAQTPPPQLPAPRYQASPMQETMIEQPNPFVLARAVLPAPTAPADQKTIIAGMAPPVIPPHMMPTAFVPPMAPAPQQPAATAPYQPMKTVALPSTEGIVSLAATGPGTAPVVARGGAGPVFWIVSILVGAAAGAVAYAIAMQV